MKVESDKDEALSSVSKKDKKMATMVFFEQSKSVRDNKRNFYIKEMLTDDKFPQNFRSDFLK